MRLPQFILRDLFWLVLVCGLAMGWWLDRRTLSAPRILIPSKTCDVGEVQTGHHGAVYFQLKNAGRLPVAFVTESGEQAGVVSVAGASEICCDWAARGDTGEALVLGTLELLTNDPTQARVEFIVTGTVTEAKSR